MPWLVGTALIHSLAVTEKRNGFKSWTVLLAITAFTLSLLGTFLVRSGLLSSVHAFAADPTRGVFILDLHRRGGGRLAGTLCVARAHAGPGAALRHASRGSRCCWATTCCSPRPWARCCWARCTRWWSTRIGWGTLSVGPPYFDTVFALVMAPLVLLMGFGPLARWKDDGVRELLMRVRWPALAARSAPQRSVSPSGPQPRGSVPPGC